MPKEKLRMDSIVKIYPNGFVANKGVTFSVNEGEIHALLGENGAGKTTLMNILFGLESHEGGTIYLDGEPTSILKEPWRSPKKLVKSITFRWIHMHGSEMFP